MASKAKHIIKQFTFLKPLHFPRICQAANFLSEDTAGTGGQIVEFLPGNQKNLRGIVNRAKQVKVFVNTLMHRFNTFKRDYKICLLARRLLNLRDVLRLLNT